ncbi:hypothetical protein GCM10010191_53350 [Actinomadura vinacea]|uniref:Uncharacterized protein n=1 Tax=Actinomadura vinacea TaxID=115336 RepID=A0ABN3JN88_9ACTN
MSTMAATRGERAVQIVAWTVFAVFVTPLAFLMAEAAYQRLTGSGKIAQRFASGTATVTMETFKSNAIPDDRVTAASSAARPRTPSSP